MSHICDVCHNIFCPPSCPNYCGYSPELPCIIGACCSCYEKLRADDKIYRYNKKMLCEKCADELISDDMLDFFECKDKKDFFELLC